MGSPLMPGEKLLRLRWLFVLVVATIALAGYAMLYSAAGGHHAPWAWRHALRFAVATVLMLAIALTDIRVFYRLAYPLYAAAVAGLVAVEFLGEIGKGAQRWLDLGFVQLQPSEIMKVALVLALARVFHGKELADLGNPLSLVVPLGLVLVPVVLVLWQPDLGTAVMLLAASGTVFFAAGVRWWKFALLIGGALAALPVLWGQMHDYQRQRVLTFLDPETDPLGAGYHIIQSKIALGSGGLWGKGFMNGSQSQLNFLPEKQTDFVFTMLAEELGLVGALAVLALCLIVVAYGLSFAMHARSQFARLLALGMACTFGLYVMINVAMVTGLIPVVGVPLPLISYGGTAMLTAMVGFGLLLSADIHRDVTIPLFADDVG
ncbi:rod shape-determining protein RodA [Marinivivus vitaminiproducens]|uniref:rod shape-determining protein RodA n=1 Tax=Marinivivus vitaminiproducens TaxID=3035935 RepID=UPI00279D110B|nr:rod shape-determining protein RodA [Geminicoccaceae bacterium SCSIO 64248]